MTNLAAIKNKKNQQTSPSFPQQQPDEMFSHAKHAVNSWKSTSEWKMAEKHTSFVTEVDKYFMHHDIHKAKLERTWSTQYQCPSRWWCTTRKLRGKPPRMERETCA